MWPLFVSAVIGWAFAVYTMIEGRKEVAANRSWFQGLVEESREREQQLLNQIQLNAQHLPYYPQVGPVDQVEEKRYLSSDDGLIVFEDTNEIDAALAEVAGM